MQVCSGLVDAAFVHRAARHHNWRRSDTTVQTWTQQVHRDAQRECRTECWDGIRAVIGPQNVEFVTHKRVQYLNDPALRARILGSMGDSEGLRRAAIEWHKDLRDTYPNGTLWLGERAEVDAARSFDANSLHAIVAELGLWHFGELNADDSSVVLRLTYRLEDDVQLYKPDWRHGYPYFYFATVPAVIDHGFTRELSTGNLQRKEWIAKISEI